MVLGHILRRLHSSGHLQILVCSGWVLCSWQLKEGCYVPCQLCVMLVPFSCICRISPPYWRAVPLWGSFQHSTGWWEAPDPGVHSKGRQMLRDSMYCRGQAPGKGTKNISQGCCSTKGQPDLPLGRKHASASWASIHPAYHCPWYFKFVNHVLVNREQLNKAQHKEAKTSGAL